MSCHGNLSFAFRCLPAHRVHQSPLACFSRALSTSPSVCFSSVQTADGVQPQFREKNSEMFLRRKTRNAARGRCLGLTPLPQTTKKARIGHPWRDQTPWCSPSCSILAKVCANCSSCFICGRFAQQTNKASSPPVNVHSMGCRSHAL